jgi:predicted RNA-binding protein YlqC (UPF0109 family)
MTEADADLDRDFVDDDDQEPVAEAGELVGDFAAGDDADDAPVVRLKGLVTYLASNLVDEPNAVNVSAERRGHSVHLSLRVPEAELGKVIGRQGRIARAMRTALMIAGSRQNVRATLDIEG